MAGDKGSKVSTKKSDKKADKKVEKVDKKAAKAAKKDIPSKSSPAKNGVPLTSEEILKMASKVSTVVIKWLVNVSLQAYLLSFVEEQQEAR